MQHSLPTLLYALSSFAPNISEETMNYHYNKHHKAYVDNLNRLIKGTKFEEMTLEEIVVQSPLHEPIFHNAGQVWNHNFYWESISPDGGGEPAGELLEQIIKEFGSFEEFKKKFSAAAMSVFGSGWTWLILDNYNKVAIKTTPNADTPLRDGEKCLLGLDVWEHAYYIDHRNNRSKYIDIFWNIANWEFAEKNYQTLKNQPSCKGLGTLICQAASKVSSWVEKLFKN